MSYLVERIRKYKVGNMSIRIWTENVLPTDYDMLSLELMGNQEQVARALIFYYQANAVEVLDEHGEGVVIYANWP